MGKGLVVKPSFLDQGVIVGQFDNDVTFSIELLMKGWEERGR
jgi:hypothetical protein